MYLGADSHYDYITIYNADNLKEEPKKEEKPPKQFITKRISKNERFYLVSTGEKWNSDVLLFDGDTCIGKMSSTVGENVFNLLEELIGDVE